MKVTVSKETTIKKESKYVEVNFGLEEHLCYKINTKKFMDAFSGI